MPVKATTTREWSAKIWLIILCLDWAGRGWSLTIQVTTTADSGTGSFRQALGTANTNPGPNTINFQISGKAPFTIFPLSALPPITAPVVINATTQPGFAGKPVVELDGASTGSGTVGLKFSAGSTASTLRGLAINRFPSQALELDSPSNTIQGNFIGTDVTGMIQHDNSAYGGIYIKSAGNLIGGTNAGNGNLISGGLGANSPGIYLSNANNNIVQGNLIGINAAGTGAFNSTNHGIYLESSSGNVIGGPVPAARNLISGNGLSGVCLVGSASTGNVIQGNYIGTDVTGSSPVQNYYGILMESCSNLIGGTVTGAGNVISGNASVGIYIYCYDANVTGNAIQGNYIGLAVNGTAALGNFDGIGISTATNAYTASANLVGGPVVGAGNVISGNNAWGIILYGDTASGNTVSGNTIQGNFIGTDPTGTVGLGNGAGIELAMAATNQIGGSATGAANVISGNKQQGIFLTNASWNIIQGNLIGTKVDGTNKLANGYHNIELQAEAANNIIGGAAAGAGNRLAWASVGYSGVYSGVRVRTGATNNLLSGNAIFSNGALGIDLSPTDDTNDLNAAGANPIVTCESGVAANAANAGQNFPTLSSVYGGATTLVSGNLNSASGKNYTLQFFASPVGDPSGYGQGQVYLGQTNLTLGSASCSSNFIAYLPVSVPVGWAVTATATNPKNNTSEFSAWVPVIPFPAMRLSLPSARQLAIAWTNTGGTFALQQTTNLTPPVTWTTVTTMPVLTNNFMVTTLGLTNRSVFYRLSAP